MKKLLIVLASLIASPLFADELNEKQKEAIVTAYQVTSAGAMVYGVGRHY